MRYHVNNNGLVGVCSADKGVCPFGESAHFNSETEAEEYSKDILANEYGLSGNRHLGIPDNVRDKFELGHCHLLALKNHFKFGDEVVFINDDKNGVDSVSLYHCVNKSNGVYSDVNGVIAESDEELSKFIIDNYSEGDARFTIHNHDESMERLERFVYGLEDMDLNDFDFALENMCEEYEDDEDDLETIEYLLDY